MTYLILEPNRIKKRKNLILTNDEKKNSQKLSVERKLFNSIKNVYKNYRKYKYFTMKD